MTILKSKIKTVSSLPPEVKGKRNFSGFIVVVIMTILIALGIYFLMPYINAISINKIYGKKTAITECNTKDYIIINKDKSYSMELTDNNCKTNYYEGTLIIKNNEITFNKNIKGTIDNNYNIIINNTKFEREENNE